MLPEAHEAVGSLSVELDLWVGWGGVGWGGVWEGGYLFGWEWEAGMCWGKGRGGVVNMGVGGGSTDERSQSKGV